MPLAIAAFGILILLSFSGGLAQSESFNSSEERVVSDDRNTTFRERNTDTGLRTTNNTNRSFNSASLVGQTQTEYLTPVVETVSAQDIEDRNVSLRGRVNMYSQKEGRVFAVYGYSARDVSNFTNNYQEYEQIPETNNDRARARLLDYRAREGVNDYNQSVYGLIVNTTYYFKVCAEHDVSLNKKKITCGAVKSFSTNPSTYSGYSGNYFSYPNVSVGSVTNIGSNEANFSGEVSMNDGIDGIVFFVYGESETRIRAVQDFDDYSDVREFDEDLQRARVGVGVRGRAEYQYEVEDLDRGTKYFYRICAEYDGERDGLVCSSVRNFTTDSRDRSSLPFVRTDTSSRVGLNGIRLKGLVEMNDYLDGIAFFVIGTSESRIDDVVTNDSFARIRQNGDEIQKILVDADADGNNNYSEVIGNLNPAANYFYRICVEYEAEDDRNRIDTFLRCGTVKSFTSL